MGSHSLLVSKLSISCQGYNVYLQTAVAAILVSVECPKSIQSEVLMVLRLYQNVKSIRKAVFNLLRSQAISCIGYNVNLQTTIAAILFFVEWPKSIASNIKIWSRSDKRFSRYRVHKQLWTDGQGHSIIRPVFRRAYKNGTDWLPAWQVGIRVGVWQCSLTV